MAHPLFVHFAVAGIAGWWLQWSDHFKPLLVKQQVEAVFKLATVKRMHCQSKYSTKSGSQFQLHWSIHKELWWYGSLKDLVIMLEYATKWLLFRQNHNEIVPKQAQVERSQTLAISSWEGILVTDVKGSTARQLSATTSTAYFRDIHICTKYKGLNECAFPSFQIAYDIEK